MDDEMTDDNGSGQGILGTPQRRCSSGDTEVLMCVEEDDVEDTLALQQTMEKVFDGVDGM